MWPNTWYAGLAQESWKKPAWTTYLGIGTVSNSFSQEVVQNVY